jgi:MFS family permease
VALDYSIINVAVPTIQHDLRISATDLQWVVTAYAVTFGGLLLVGGRAGDAFGTRRVFLAGLAVLTVASAAAGIAWSASVLIATRALQGVGAALAAPAGLALISSLFGQGPERERALGVYGALLASGFVTGVALGGGLTSLLGWRSVMFMSMAGAGLIFVLALSAVPQQETRRPLPLPVVAGLASTTCVMALIYGLARGHTAGFDSFEVLSALAGSLALAVAFVVAERRSTVPLIPLSVVRKPTLAGGSIVAALAGAGAAGAVFVLTLYFQQVLHFDPLETGLLFTTLGGAAVVAGVVAPRRVRALGAPRALTGFLFLQAVGTLILLPISVDGSLLLLSGGMALLGFGHVSAVVGFATLATTGIRESEHGLASGVLNAAFETGSGAGVAVLATVAAARLERPVVPGAPGHGVSGEVLTEAYQHALAAGVAITLLAGMICVVALKRRSWDEASRPERPSLPIGDGPVV